MPKLDAELPELGSVFWIGWCLRSRGIFIGARHREECWPSARSLVGIRRLEAVFFLEGAGPLYRRLYGLLGVLAVVTVFAGCRRAAPPSFTPGEQVVKLTEGVEEAEERQIYEGLQAQIANVLRQQTGTPDTLTMLGGQDGDQTRLKQGYALYSQYCTQCHGVNGDGNGPVAEYLNPKPRDYTQGVFKFTSTPYGNKPRRSDLVHTVRRGVTGTSMPSFDRFSEEQVETVVDYVLALTLRGELERELAMIAFDDEEVPDDEDVQEIIAEKLEPWQQSANQLVMPVSMMPPMTDESVLTGHRIFLKFACNKCHGKYGRGGSMGNVDVGTDIWGFKGAAADLSSGMFRGGGRPIDIYRRIYSGINGTPMPAFKKTFQDDPDAIWQLVHFIRATGERRRQGKAPLSEVDLPDAPPTSVEEPPSGQQPKEEADIAA